MSKADAIVTLWPLWVAFFLLGITGYVAWVGCREARRAHRRIELLRDQMQMFAENSAYLRDVVAQDEWEKKFKAGATQARAEGL